MSFWSRLQQKKPTLGIRGKVVGIALGVTVLLMLSTIMYVRTTLHSHLGRELDRRTVAITRDVAARGAEPILTGNIFDLHRLAYDTLENNPDAVYVFFVDSTGGILAHTFKEYFPPALLDVEHKINGPGYSLRKFRTEDGILRDVAVPVLSGPDPDIFARVGLVDYSLQHALAAVTPRLMSISAVTFAMVSVIIYILVTLSTIRPLNSLLGSVQAVAQGNLSQRVTVNTSDELSTLASAFNHMTEQLETAHKARDHLMKTIIHSQEDERRRISRELHDETGQMLSTLMISLSFLERSTDLQDLKGKTAQFRELLLKSLEQVRLLAWHLTPAPLVDLGLEAALESMVRKYHESADWAISLLMEGLEHRRLPSEVEVTVYRVIQEALTNISRHARAKNVGIFLNCRDDRLMVMIEDDGVGFHPAEHERLEEKTSLGLRFMRERVSLVGGRLEVESGPGQGTVLYITIPLPPNGGDQHPGPTAAHDR
ncbi:MAG: sensor histidine kinase [Bacillota bacterium]